MSILRILLCLCFFIASPATLLAAEENFSVTGTAGISAEAASPQLIVAVTLHLPNDSYIYGLNEASAGLPTQITVTGHSFDGQEVFPDLQLFSPRPAAKKETRFASGEDDDINIYDSPTTFFLEVPAFGGTTTFDVSVSGLLCSASNCTPFEKTLPMEYQGAELSSLPSVPVENYSFLERSFLPPGPPSASVSENNPLEFASLFEPAYDFFTPEYFQPGLEVTTLSSAIFLGLLAGLLLNIMPCVLPVLSLKFSALMAVTSMTDRGEQARAFRLHCLIFAAGIMTWFVILALLFGLAGMAWGELFQLPAVVVILAIILFLLGLSLFGVFTLPIIDLKASSSANPHWQAFTSGLLATLLATPCSGPLLGGVIGWALQQPLDALVVTILSVGLGMTIPYCILALKPRLVNLLPKPGLWTLRLEQLLGFFLMGSVVYLVSLLPDEWLLPFLICLIAIAFAAWLWGQVGHLGARRWVRRVARLAAVATLALAVWGSNMSLTENPAWESFSPELFNSLLGNENVLVQFTADWCPSCKALEYTTLNEKRMKRLRSKHSMRTIRVDLTRENKSGQALLEAVGSSSIPVLVLFPKGEGSTTPLVLRDIVTPSQLKDALRQRFN